LAGGHRVGPLCLLGIKIIDPAIECLPSTSTEKLTPVTTIGCVNDAARKFSAIMRSGLHLSKALLRKFNPASGYGASPD
jgi:hypothetical protein